jgi:hypothetical protein
LYHAREYSDGLAGLHCLRHRFNVILRLHLLNQIDCHLDYPLVLGYRKRC